MVTQKGKHFRLPLEEESAAALSLSQHTESVPVQYLQAAPGEGNQPFLREILQHAGYHLTRRTHVPGDLLMGQQQAAAVRLVRFIRKESGQAPSSV